MSFTLNSGLKIFDIIEILWKNPKSREELSSKLLERGFCIETETISKYIRTLRAVGFEIETTKGNPYKIIKAPFPISLNEKELNGLNIALSVLNFFSITNKKDCHLLKYKTLGLLKNDITGSFLTDICNYSTDKSFWENLFELNKYTCMPSKIRITYIKNKLLIIPKKLKYKQNGVFLTFYDIREQKIRVVNIKFIQDIKLVCKLKENEMVPARGTVFRLTGRLIKNYIVKEGEVAHYKDLEVRVTNYFEDKEELFSRLMKYGKNCEVVFPKSDRDAFREKLKNVIKHYKSI